MCAGRPPPLLLQSDRHRDGEVLKSIFTATHTHTQSPRVAMEAIPSIPQTDKCRIVARGLPGPKQGEPNTLL